MTYSPTVLRLTKEECVWETENLPRNIQTIKQIEGSVVFHFLRVARGGRSCGGVDSQGCGLWV